MTNNLFNSVLSNSQRKLQESSTLEFSLNAPVNCLEGHSGKLTHVIINPTTLQVSHLVVEHPDLFGSVTRLVPMEYVSSTSPQLIKLNCTQDELVQMELFRETHYIENERWEREMLYWPWDSIDYASDSLMSWSYPFPERMMSYLVVEKENLPSGELAIGQKVQVQASDGLFGKFSVLLVERNTQRLSGLVVQSGHFFWVKERFLPITLIERIEDGGVYLKSDTKTLETFPSIPRKQFLNQTYDNYSENLLKQINGITN